MHSKHTYTTPTHRYQVPGFQFTDEKCEEVMGEVKQKVHLDPEEGLKLKPVQGGVSDVSTDDWGCVNEVFHEEVRVVLYVFMYVVVCVCVYSRECLLQLYVHEY